MPELFLNRGLARFASRLDAVPPRERTRASALGRAPRAAFAVELPRDLVQLFEASGGRALGDFVPGPRAGRGTAGALRPDAFATLVAAARNAEGARARLCAFLAGTVPFGATRGGDLWIYVLGEPSSPSRGVVATLDPAVPGAPKLAFRDASTFAFACALDIAGSSAAPMSATPARAARTTAASREAFERARIADIRAKLAVPGVAEQEGVRASFERAMALLDLLIGGDAALRRAAKKLAVRPFEPPHPPREATDDANATKASSRSKERSRTAGTEPTPPSSRSNRSAGPAATASTTSAAAAAESAPLSVTRILDPRSGRTSPLALAALVEAFFRKESAELDAIVAAQHRSGDALVRQAAAVLTAALDTSRKPRSALARELARRRAIALRAARTVVVPEVTSSADRAQRTRRIIELVDAARPATDPLATTEPREEALLALAEMGDGSAVPSLIARAVTGDVGAVDMLAALGDARAVAPLVAVLHREPQRHRLLEAAVVRALASLESGSPASGITKRFASDALRALLAENPMPSWREGIERGALVKELVAALGSLRDEHSGPALLEIFESRSQEYRAILPIAAWSLGRIRHLPALATLERLLASPKEPPTSEAIWAVGAIGAAHPSGVPRAVALLDALKDLEPGAELVRLTALAKAHAATNDGPRPAELRRALERALWEPAFRQEESSRRRTWAMRSLEELAATRSAAGSSADKDPYFLGHEAIRYFVTRDDHRVRRAAEDAFAAWGAPVPATRRYYVKAVDELEARGGPEALHEALRDPLGVYRHNVASRLAERADRSSVRPLAEATARLFAEPPTSTYEYDDAPSHLVAFVRALAKLNRPEGNDVLIEGLRAGNHQVRAVVAENAPEDPRFVPELMAMLGDPRSFLRSRAERSLAALGVPAAHGSEQPPRLAPLS